MAIKDGSTPLMVAAGLGARRGGDEEVIEKAGRADPVDAMKLFVEAGAKVNAANDLGNTALHYAALNGSRAGRRVPRRQRGFTRPEEQAGKNAARTRKREGRGGSRPSPSDYSISKLSGRDGGASRSRLRRFSFSTVP